MHSYKLSPQAKLALVLCWPDGVNVHPNPDHINASAIEDAMRDFQGSVEGCSKLRACLERAVELRSEK